MICNAFGGWTGLSTTLQFPDRIKALILVGSPASIQTESIKREYTEGLEKNKKYVSIDEQFKGQGESQWIEYLNDMELAPGFSTRNKHNALLYRQIARNNLHIPKNVKANIAGMVCAKAPQFIFVKSKSTINVNIITSMNNCTITAI